LSIELHDDSVETLYFPVRSEHPTSGEIDLTGQTVHVALPVVGVAPSVWVAATWLNGSMRKGDDRYFIASVSTSGFTLNGGSSYQGWVRVGGASGAIVKASGVIKVVTA
jgi:hypothetical protein